MKIIMTGLLFFLSFQLTWAKEKGCYQTLKGKYEETRSKNDQKNEKYRHRSTLHKIVKKLVKVTTIVSTLTPVPSLIIKAPEKAIKEIASNDDKITSMATLAVSHQFLDGELRLEVPEDANMLKRFLQSKSDFETANNIKEPLSKKDFAKYIVNLDKNIESENNPFCEYKGDKFKIKKLKAKSFEEEVIKKHFAQYKSNQRNDNLTKILFGNKSEESIAPSFLQRCKSILPTANFDNSKSDSIQELKGIKKDSSVIDS